VDLELAHYNRDGIEVVAVMTELDVYTAPKVSELLMGLIEQQRYELVLDLGNVEFRDSTALVNVLVEGPGTRQSHSCGLKQF
jgi:anti-sigma B factor antagonist